MKFIDKAILKLHSSIRFVRAQLGEQEAEASQNKASGSNAKKAKETKKPKKVIRKGYLILRANFLKFTYFCRREMMKEKQVKRRTQRS